MTKAKNKLIDYSSYSEIYNKPFSLDELNFVLSRTKNTSTGIDGIYYQMLKNLPEIIQNH